MRRLASFLLAAGLTVGVAAPAHAAGTSSDPTIAARDAAAWLVTQVTDEGYVRSAFDPTQPNLSATAWAVTALAAAGVGRTTMLDMVAYLGEHAEEMITATLSGADGPGQLALLIFAALAAGEDPRAFGPTSIDLVARLAATRQPSGLYGSDDATYDGAFRQGLALVALYGVGEQDAGAVAWLVDQQCDDGLWVPFRADTSAPCPPPDLTAFTGPDSNSTALAIAALALFGEQGAAESGVTALDGVRSPDGGWGYIVGQDTDANSTGTVLPALRTVTGNADEAGTEALAAFQVGCDADAADRGGIAYQPVSGALTPDAYATAQAIPGLAGATFPVTAGDMTDDMPAACTQAAGSTTTTVTVDALAPTTAPPPTTVASSAAGELPRTGSPGPSLPLAGALVCAVGLAVWGGARARRR
jgi:hypothetical protein